MKRAMIAGGMFAALSCAPALAADIPMKAPASAPVAAPLFNWSGFYVGVNGGYAQGDYDYVFPLLGRDVGRKLDGWVLGGTLGWNWQAPGNNAVFGIESDLAWADINGNSLCPNPTFSCNARVSDWLGTVRGRFGVSGGLIPNTMLVYVTGGFAVGQVERESADPNVPLFLNQRKTARGWTGGAGLEWAFAPNWSAKVEWLYVDLDREAFPSAAGGSFSQVNIGTQFNLVRAGLNYRFATGKYPVGKTPVAPAPVVTKG
jgi:outer membrane immunogenic protein